jgi:DNA-binding response OmpR family regulator
VLKRVDRALVKDRYETQDLSIDFKSRKVRVQEEDVKLTKTEFELLDLLVSHPDETLSRDFIMNQR